MHDVTNNASAGPRFLVAAYGVEGITAMKLLVHADSSLCEKRNNHTTTLMLDEVTNTKILSEYLDGIDMVFILGSDDDIVAPKSALQLAMICNEKEIHCFTILSFSDTAGELDDSTRTLYGLSNNVLLLRFSRTVDNLKSCFMLVAAVASIIDPLLNHGLVGIDLDDFKQILSQGKHTNIGLACAKGKNRAHEAAKYALQQLPNKQFAASMTAIVTCGTTLKQEEFNTIMEKIRTAADIDCTVLVCTAPHQNHIDELQLTVMCLKQKQGIAATL